MGCNDLLSRWRVCIVNASSQTTREIHGLEHRDNVQEEEEICSKLSECINSMELGMGVDPENLGAYEN